MKIAMLLPLLPLYAAAQKTAACPNNGAACHCGAKNPSAEDCLAEWMIHGPTDAWEVTLNEQCAQGNKCQSCDWCPVVFKCNHADCKKWECAEWCHCYEKGFDDTYADAGCADDGEDCKCK